MSKIRIVNGPYRGRERTLGEKPLTIGRDAEAGIQILDRSASRFHAEIFPVGGMYFVRDLESKNGTYVNDEKIGDEELLRERDVIKIGSTELMFESGSALSDDESSSRISYRDDPDMLSNTLEFRLDALADIAEPAEQNPAYQDNERTLRMLYQVGRLLADGGHDKEAKVLDLLVHGLPAEAALVFRRDGATGKLVPTVVRTAAPNIQPVISRSIIKKTFSENKALHSANAAADERFDRNASVVQKNIRSVICVPLAVGGQTRGVLYLSRGDRDEPFDQIELEAVSATAIQLGFAQHAAEQRRRHRDALLRAVAAMLHPLEVRGGLVGSGERCARFCAAIAGAMKLDGDSRDRLACAGLLHHLPRLCTDAPGAEARVLQQLATVDALEGVPGLLRYLSTGRATDDEHEVETHILTAAAAFELRTAADPGVDVEAVIQRLREDTAFDASVIEALHACHVDGSLYATRSG